MGIIQGLVGHATSVDLESIEEEYRPLLVRDEKILSAHKFVRDMIVFTSHRVITMDAQGITGRKKSFTSIPYHSIIKFSKESAGWADYDAELRIWVRGESQPIKWEFRKSEAVNDIFRILSEGVLT